MRLMTGYVAYGPPGMKLAMSPAAATWPKPADSPSNSLSRSSGSNVPIALERKRAATMSGEVDDDSRTVLNTRPRICQASNHEVRVDGKRPEKDDALSPRFADQEVETAHIPSTPTAVDGAYGALNVTDWDELATADEAFD